MSDFPTPPDNVVSMRVIDRELRERHQRLVTALGSEANPGQWMEFMKELQRQIPHVMNAQGKPSKEQIDESMIGQLGFSSWSEMIKAKRESNGLGWSVGGWNGFRRAWNIVQDFPYLRELPIKAGWLNSVYAELKRTETPFPATAEAYQALLESRKQAQIDTREATTTELKERVNEAERQSSDTIRQLADLFEKYNALVQEHSQTQIRTGQLQQQLNSATAENGKLLSAVEQLEKQTSILSDSKQSLRDDLDKTSKYTSELENTLKAASKSVWSRLQFVLRGA